MRKNLSIGFVAISLAVSLAACGDDDDDDDDHVHPDAAAVTPDAAPTPDADPDQPDAADLPACNAAQLDPQDDISAAGVFDIVISEISIDGDFVELYNNTNVDIALDSLTTHKWCSRPSYTNVAASSQVIPAKGYATIPFPTSGQSNAGGELQLYLNSSYGSANSVLDYVCWGTGPDSARSETACMAGKWDTDCDARPFVPGACAPAIDSGGSIARRVGTAGDTAADYEKLTTPTPENCTTL